MGRIKKIKKTKLIKKAANLRLFQQVKTPHGIGILLSVDTPGNGLYYEPERARYHVWYGVENEHTEWTGSEDPEVWIGKHIAFTYTLDELTPL